MQLLADPQRRAELNDLAQQPSAFRGVARWERLTVGEVTKPELTHFEGRTIGEIADEQGITPWEALCDLVVADDLKTGLYPRAAGDDDDSWALRQELWNDDRCVIGASDAGAHLDFLATFNYSTYLLAAARDRQMLELEDAVHKLTDVPARLYGLAAAVVWRRAAMPMSWSSTLTGWRRSRSRCARTCPAAHGASTARPTASTRC